MHLGKVATIKFTIISRIRPILDDLEVERMYFKQCKEKLPALEILRKQVEAPLTTELFPLRPLKTWGLPRSKSNRHRKELQVEANHFCTVVGL